VFFSYQITFELYHLPHPRNDVIWTPGKENIEQMPVSKFGPKVIVRRAIPFSCLSYMHIVPQGQTINQEYYCQHILEGNLLEICKGEN
jgi:hypothetical protein